MGRCVAIGKSQAIDKINRSLVTREGTQLWGRRAKRARRGLSGAEASLRGRRESRAPNGARSPGMEVFTALYSFASSSFNPIQTESAAFRLHCGATFAILITFSVAITTRQYVGNPIDCIHTRDIPEDVLNTFCWIHSTYLLEGRSISGKDSAYPGVRGSKNGAERRPAKYYQWVAFTLFIQAMMFYTPRWLWKSWEGGRMRTLIGDLDIGICSEIEKKAKKKLILDYLFQNLKFNNWWAYKYFFCEILSLINVVGQMFLMNKFFDGEFLTFGLDVLTYMDSDQEDRVDPMIYIFPRMVKCTMFHKFGPAGEVEAHDSLCILPLNVVNEKIYIFLWFWFLILGFLTTVILIYRLVIILSPRMRVYIMRMRFRLIKKEAVDTIVRESKMGDWYLLYILGENLDSIIFRDILHDLSNKLSGHNYHFRGVQEA